MRRPVALLLCVFPAWAHVMSMSSGDLAIQGASGRYELRMPLYELTHLRDPEASLLAHIRFSSSGRDAVLRQHSCRQDDAAQFYVCSATYDVPAPVDRLDVECTFASVTVPNHVHLLRVTLDGKRDQALFDLSFPKASLRFRPATAAEIAITQAGAGFMGALGGAAQILILAALVLAARSRRELLLLAAMFIAGEVAAVALVPLTAWQAPARFVEAAAALSVAYLAVEILLLPGAGARWLVALVLGSFHGLYFLLFLETSGYRAPLVLGGAAAAQCVTIALVAVLFARLLRLADARRTAQVCASALLVFGMVWFVLRLRG